MLKKIYTQKPVELVAIHFNNKVYSLQFQTQRNENDVFLKQRVYMKFK